MLTFLFTKMCIRDSRHRSGPWLALTLSTPASVSYTHLAPVADFKKAYTTFATVASTEGVTPKFLQLLLQALSTPAGPDLDVKAMAGAGGEPGAEVMGVFEQNGQRHQQAIEKMFPVFHKPTTLKTVAGPMLFFGSFAIFGDSKGDVIVDDNPSAPAPAGFKPLSA